MLDGAEVEEEPSPNLIDHHLLQSFKTLHQKLTKKCVVQPIFHLCRLMCQSLLAEWRVDAHQAIRVPPAVQHRRGPDRGALVDRPGQAVPGPAPYSTLWPHWRSRCFAHSWPWPGWAMTPTWRLLPWPRHAASRPWATPPSRPNTSSMPVPSCVARRVCRLVADLCEARRAHVL